MSSKNHVFVVWLSYFVSHFHACSLMPLFQSRIFDRPDWTYKMSCSSFARDAFVRTNCHAYCHDVRRSLRLSGRLGRACIVIVRCMLARI